ncbi:hypothetical protein DYB37_011029 [Aphanomyces astaci]|uniref:Uncharacterized protein n=1 Tax=Aphanomyces astaci TaxID=112090 RepID=A0A3R7EV24_APHAT|nr:hypothetical protein DYB37_011029 [Aphanomyces astaci]
MVQKLLALAQDETCDDDSLLRAIAEATPYKQKVGTATFWVETGGASRGLDNRFYVDITNIRYNFDSVELMKTLRRLKTLPLFQEFRSTIAGTSCHTNAWRIYFCTEDIPTNLIINNHPVDQLRFQGVTYAVYAKLYTPSRHMHVKNKRL